MKVLIWIFGGYKGWVKFIDLWVDEFIDGFFDKIIIKI